MSSIANSGRFTGGWRGVKVCTKCSKDFQANSGSQIICKECKRCEWCHEYIVGKNRSWKRFCNNSCAGKWKYRNYASVRASTVKARNSPNRAIGISRYRKGRPRLDLRGELNNNWKGDNVGYQALHHWVTRHKGRATKCDHCGTKDSSRYEWANVSHEYLRDLDDWIELCKKCHMKYDSGLNSIKEIFN